MTEEKKDGDEKSGFTVSDKRHFTSEGDVTSEPVEGEKAAEEASEPPRAEEPPQPPPEKGAPPPEMETGEEPPVDFTHLVMSLASTAFISLGVPDPVTKQKGPVNLKAASQMIDLLKVIGEKTRGNLTAEEEQLLTGISTDLRSVYVQASGFVR